MKKTFAVLAALLALTGAAKAQAGGPALPAYGNPVLCYASATVQVVADPGWGYVRCDSSGQLIISNPGGGSGSSTVTANQGTAGATPWPVSVTSLPSLPAGSNSIGIVTVAPGGSSYTVNNTSNASGGMAAGSRITSSAASTNLTNVKTSNNRLYKVFACNTAASARFIKFYNVASTGAVTVGTTAVTMSREFPPSTCSSLDWGNIGFFFSTGLTFAITTGTADTDATAIAAGDILQLSVETN